MRGTGLNVGAGQRTFWCVGLRGIFGVGSGWRKSYAGFWFWFGLACFGGCGIGLWGAGICWCCFGVAAAVAAVKRGEGIGGDMEMGVSWNVVEWFLFVWIAEECFGEDYSIACLGNQGDWTIFRVLQLPPLMIMSWVDMFLRTMIRCSIVRSFGPVMQRWLNYSL